MIHLSLLLAASTIPFVPIMFWFSLRMRRRVYPSQWEMQARMAEMVGKIDDAVSGVRVVKGFGQERREFKRVTDALGALFGSRMRNWRLRSRRTSTLQTVPQLGQVAVLAIGGWLVFDGRDPVGTLVAFFAYLTQLMSPARQMAGVLVVAQQARAGAERVLELLDSLPDVVEKPDAVELCPLGHGRISFEHVSFGYLRSEPVLHGFDLRGAAPARRWHWWGRRARASRRRAPPPALLRRPGGLGPGRRYRRTRRDLRLPCVARSASSSRTPSCSPTRSRPTSPTAAPTPPTPRSRRRPERPRHTASSCDLPDGYDTVVGENAACCFRGASASGSPSPGP